jgi:alpha-beta hydrolase superfamily lysophospholipase
MRLPLDATRARIVVDPAPPAVARQVVFAFHGLTETPARMQDYSGLDALASNAACRIVYPLGSRVPPKLPLVRGWDFWQAASNDLAYVCNLKNQYAPQQKTVMLGFSAGACFANTLGCAQPAMVAAVVSYAGYLGRGWQVPAATDASFPVLVLRNADDRLVRLPETLALCEAYRQAGYAVEYHELPSVDGAAGYELESLLTALPRPAQEDPLDWAMRLARHARLGLADFLRKIGHWWQPAATDIVRDFLEARLHSLSG